MGTSKSGGKRIRIWHIFLIILGVGIFGAIIALLADTPERQALKMLAIEKIDFTNLQDGVYVGEYKGRKNHFRDTTVEVTISNRRITDIKILKGALDSKGNPVKMKGGMTMDILFQKVIESQSLQVDTISGATLTSKAHLKALEKALKQALKKQKT